MKKAKYLFFAIVIFASCTHEKSPRELAIDQIKKAESLMHQDMKMNDSTAVSAINAYDAFVQKFPDDKLSPDFLFKSAEIATASKQYDKALLDYQQIVSKYPKYALYQESYFLEASLLDNYMDRDGEAKKIYEEIIDKFPKSNYAKDAHAALANLGLTDQELIQEFKAKNHE